MVKNRHLLASLVVLGVLNLLAFFALLFGERDSARAARMLERQLAADREEARQSADSLRQQAEELRQRLDTAQSSLEQLRDEVATVRSLAAKMRRAVDAIEERLNKGAQADQETAREKRP